MDGLWWTILAVLVLFRLLPLRKYWRLPRRYGETWFLSTEVGPDFYGGPGAGVVRRYRLALLLPFAADAALVAALVAGGKGEYVLLEQTASFVLTAIFYALVVIHFATGAKAFAAPQAAAERPPTALHLSLEPRRLRDHTNWPVEALVAALTAAALVLLATRFEAGDDEAGAAVSGAVWMLYLQTGVLLLKHVFVRARMRMPVSRAEDYTRWRAAWLVYHLRIFDAVRVVIASVMTYIALDVALDLESAAPAAAIFWAVAAVVFVAYTTRERRRLAVVEREVAPITLAREIPPSPIAEGRFLAGGLLYFNPDHPAMLARSPHGVAVNLANRSTYLWAAYLTGFVLLVARMVFA